MHNCLIYNSCFEVLKNYPYFHYGLKLVAQKYKEQRSLGFVSNLLAYFLFLINVLDASIVIRRPSALPNTTCVSYSAVIL